MNNQGWISIHRKIQESEIWDKPHEWLKIWLYILLNVSYEDKRYPRGTYYFRYEWIAKANKTTYDQVRRCVEYLKISHSIATQKATHGIIITVLNFAKYQDLSNQESHEEKQNQAIQKPNRSHNTSNNTINVIKNKDILQPAVAEEIYNYKNQLDKMFKDKNKRMNIIAYYWTIKGFNFDNKQKYSSALKRELRPAGDLIGYSNEDIKRTCEWLKNNADFKWTLETVLKYIDEPLEKMKAGGKLQTEEDYIKSLKQKHYGAN